MKGIAWMGLLALVVCAASAFGETLWETDFSANGNEPMIARAGDDEACWTQSLNVPSTLLAQSSNDVFLFVHVRMPAVEKAGQKDAFVRARVNDTDLGALKTEFLSCGEPATDDEGGLNVDCFRSVHVPAAIVNAGANEVHWCAKASANVPQLEILPTSRFGIYRLPDFSDEASFALEASELEPVIGSIVSIQYRLTNNGHAPAVFRIDRAVNTQNALDKPYYRVVEGQSFVENGRLGPGESAVFTHSVRVKALGAVTLPPAIVYWSQELSDKTVVDLWRTSNQPTLVIRAPDRKIEAFLVHSPEGLFTQSPESISLQVKNTGEDPVYNLVVGVKPQASNALELKNLSNASIEALQPGQTATVNLVFVANQAGTFAVDCTAEFLDLGLSENVCPGATVTFKDEGLSPLVVGSAILVILSIGIYAYFYFVP